MFSKSCSKEIIKSTDQSAILGHGLEYNCEINTLADIHERNVT